jgi:hypothetical protein
MLIVQDTSKLFAAIDQSPPSDKDIIYRMINPLAPLRSEKSLEEVAMIMFGQDPARAPTRCGNAGNDAYVSSSYASVSASAPSC